MAEEGIWHGSCWVTFSQPSFPTGEWKESNILILTCFKDFVDFGLIVIKNILLCTVEDLHLICCNRQQLCDARWKHEIASEDWLIGVLLPSVWTETSVPSIHKPWSYLSRDSRFVFLSLCFFFSRKLLCGEVFTVFPVLLLASNLPIVTNQFSSSSLSNFLFQEEARKAN